MSTKETGQSRPLLFIYQAVSIRAIMSDNHCPNHLSSNALPWWPSLIHEPIFLTPRSLLMPEVPVFYEPERLFRICFYVIGNEPFRPSLICTRKQVAEVSKTG